MAKEQKPAETGDRGGSQPEYSPLDDKAIVKNPTSEPYQADAENREEQRKQGGK